MMSSSYRRIFMGIIIFISGIFFYLWHKHKNTFSYYGEIWADRAGYYVYLPFIFNYHAKSDTFIQKDISNKTGLGFTIQDNKVYTKYPYTVALMQLPFYLCAEGLYAIAPKGIAGFSIYHHKMVALAGLVYFWIGMLFLYSFLRYYYTDKIVIFTLLTIFLGTNVFYYAVREGGMSHIYSFCLFSVYLFLLKKTGFLSKTTRLESIILGFIVGGIILTRYTNGIFIALTYLLLDINRLSEIKNRINTLFTLRKEYILYCILLFILIFIPQLLYWKYACGTFICYSYQKEGFNWLKPQLLKFLFCPNNGLFLFTPLMFLILAGTINMIYVKKQDGYVLGITWLIITYIYSCWWTFNFGCSFGSRNYVEYYALFALSMGFLYQKIFSQSRYKYVYIVFIALCVLYNVKMANTFDGCMYLKQDWDWEAVKSLITGSLKI